jgi:hypothetical protein
MEIGVFEAIDLHYLKSLSFIVAKEYNAKDDEFDPNVIESYTFRVSQLIQSDQSNITN